MEYIITFISLDGNKQQVSVYAANKAMAKLIFEHTNIYNEIVSIQPNSDIYKQMESAIEYGLFFDIAVSQAIGFCENEAAAKEYTLSLTGQKIVNNYMQKSKKNYIQSVSNLRLM
jgi:hypothetical protein